MKHPTSVLIAQFVIASFALLLISGSIPVVSLMKDDLTYYGQSFMTWPMIMAILLRYYLFAGPFILLNVVALIAMSLRRGFGRWLGIGALSILVLALASHIAGGSQLLEQFLQSESRLQFGMVVQIAFLLISFLALIQLAFSRSAKAFFIRKVAILSAEPPPPPSFN